MKKLIVALVLCATLAWAASTSKQFTLNVAPSDPYITTTVLPDAQVGVSYQATLTGSGGVPPYTYAVTAGSLPNGLTLSSAGAISGTPTTYGAFTFTVNIYDSRNASSAVKASAVVR